VLDRGSTFWFTIVFEKQAEITPPWEFPEDIRGQRILVVDDNATNRHILREHLQLWGCVPSEATGPEEAIAQMREAYLSKAPFRVAILDMEMPKMEGAELGRLSHSDPDL